MSPIREPGNAGWMTCDGSRLAGQTKEWYPYPQPAAAADTGSWAGTAAMSPPTDREAAEAWQRDPKADRATISTMAQPTKTDAGEMRQRSRAKPQAG